LRFAARRTARRLIVSRCVGCVAASECSLHHQAAPRVPRIGDKLDAGKQQLLGYFSRRWLDQRFAYVAARPFGIAVERLAE
jgi:hypothetical protein